MDGPSPGVASPDVTSPDVSSPGVSKPAFARLCARGGWRVDAASALAGAALTLAQPPLGLWPALFLAWPALLALLAAAPSPRAAARLGWWAGVGFFLTGVGWIGQAFLAEAGRIWWHAPLMPVAVGALAGALALYWAGAFWLARRLAAPGWRAAVALGAAMTLAELARGAALTGFPWALQAYAWTDTPVAQAASVTGAYTLAGITVAGAATVGAGWRPALAVAALVAATWGWGAWRLAQAPRDVDGPLIRLVQPNVPQAERWAPERQEPIFRDLLALTALPGAPALVAWPEVATPFLYLASPAAVAMAADPTPAGATLVVGAVRAEGEGTARRLHNSLIVQDAAGAVLATYDKRRLTPFGEYVPYVWILGRLGLGTLGEGLSGFTPGAPATPLTPPGLPPVALLICYEIVFPIEARRAAKGADWLLQATNDSWFGDSAGPRQHLAQARFRAIELGLPVARAANTGVSAMIDPYGRIRDQLPLGVRGVVDSPLPAPAAATLARRFGDAPPLALWLCAAAAMLLMRARRDRGVRG